MSERKSYKHISHDKVSIESVLTNGELDYSKFHMAVEGYGAPCEPLLCGSFHGYPDHVHIHDYIGLNTEGTWGDPIIFDCFAKDDNYDLFYELSRPHVTINPDDICISADPSWTGKAFRDPSDVNAKERQNFMRSFLKMIEQNYWHDGEPLLLRFQRKDGSTYEVPVNVKLNVYSEKDREVYIGKFIKDGKVDMHNLIQTIMERNEPWEHATIANSLSDYPNAFHLGGREWLSTWTMLQGRSWEDPLSINGISGGYTSDIYQIGYRVKLIGDISGAEWQKNTNEGTVILVDNPFGLDWTSDALDDHLNVDKNERNAFLTSFLESVGEWYYKKNPLRLTFYNCTTQKVVKLQMIAEITVMDMRTMEFLEPIEFEREPEVVPAREVTEIETDSTLPEFLESNQRRSDYYVYTHTKKTDGSVVYVGKGTGGRFKSSDRKSMHKKALQDGKLNCQIIIDNLTELEARTLESGLIRAYYDLGAVLYNQIM